MANYDFNNLLSPERFQDLGRDILQIKYGKDAETFKKVRDEGIDIKIKQNQQYIYGQVKRFSNLSRLKYQLKTEELKKVKRLKPDRYILITSLDYTPKDKDEILKLFEGYIQNTEDIIGKSDINNFLEQKEYEKVKRKYYELWWDSFEVLEELLDSSSNKSIYQISRRKLKDISENEKTYIDNNFSEEAQSIIRENNCILITGEAGIGKTALAYHLIYQMMQDLNTKFVYVYSPEEILKSYKEEVNQIFLMDDFWGSIFENSYEKREEKKFLDVIDMIRNSDNKKLILTSRDYILKEGLKKHSKMYDELLENKVILKLQEFSNLLKAQILFEHLDKSMLRWEIVNEIASNYKLIINHSMYNPRLIAGYVKSIEKETNLDRLYLKDLLDYLDNPEKFIKEVFDEQSQSAKIVLILLLLMRRSVEQHELKSLFYQYVDTVKNEKIKKSDFSEVLKSLDGNLVKIYRDEHIEDEIIINIEFQNPSIEEYVYQYVAENIDDYVEDIIRSTNSLNILTSLSGVYLLSKNYTSNFYNTDTGHKLFVENIEETMTNKLINSYDKLEYIYKKDVFDKQFSEGFSELNKIIFLIKINDEIFSDRLREFIQSKIDAILDDFIKQQRFFTYEDMYEVIPLISKAEECNYSIRYKPLELINAYWRNIKFSYQYKLMNDFSEIYSEIYQAFLKENIRKIRKHITELVISDVEFYEEEYDKDLWDFIDFELPEILGLYKIALPKWAKEEIEGITGYIIWNHKKQPKPKKKRNKVKKRKQKSQIKVHIGKEEILINKELEKLIGIQKHNYIYDEKKLVYDIVRNKKLAEKVYDNILKLKQIRIPIWLKGEKFFKQILTFINKTNKPYDNFAILLEELIEDLLGKVINKEEVKEKLEKFCYEMCVEGSDIWREEFLKTKTDFSEDTIKFLLRRKILYKNNHWIEFFNDSILLFFCVKHSISINENAWEFMNKMQNCGDYESLILLMYESINAEKINKELIQKELEEYLINLESDNAKLSCKRILQFFEYELEFDKRIELDGVNYTRTNVDYIFEYTSYDLLDNVIDKLVEIKKDKKDFEKFKAKFARNNQYVINFVKCFNDEEMYKLFEKYGVWKEFYYSVEYSKKLLKTLQDNDYKIDIRKV